ncbi:MAG: hypothetical protein ACOYJ6_16495, partial [Caulobacterales bacterium]
MPEISFCGFWRCARHDRLEHDRVGTEFSRPPANIRHEVEQRGAQAREFALQRSAIHVVSLGRRPAEPGIEALGKRKALQ